MFAQVCQCLEEAGRDSVYKTLRINIEFRSCMSLQEVDLRLQGTKTSSFKAAEHFLSRKKSEEMKAKFKEKKMLNLSLILRRHLYQKKNKSTDF